MLRGVGSTVCSRLLWISVLLVFSITMGAAPCRADVITFEMDVVFSGDSPSLDPPWLTATFDDDPDLSAFPAVQAIFGPDDVLLTFQARPGTSANTEKFTELYFNLDPNLDPNDLTFTFVQLLSVGTNSMTVQQIVPNEDGEKADGDGYFDVRFDLATSAQQGNLFNYSDTLVYIVGGISGLTAHSFDFLSVRKQGGDLGPFNVAAHVQSIPGKDSGWIANTPTRVPEPSLLLFLGLGLSALAFWGRRKRLPLPVRESSAA